MKTKKKYKKAILIPSVIALLAIIAVTVFVQFTPIGYCMSVKYRNYTEVEHNIYVDNSFPKVDR